MIGSTECGKPLLQIDKTGLSGRGHGVSQIAGSVPRAIEPIRMYNGTAAAARRCMQARQTRHQGRSCVWLLVGESIVPGDASRRTGAASCSKAAVMVFSLLAYFFSMLTAFAIVMTALVGFGDSQMRTTRLPHYTAVSIIANSDRDALTNVDKAKEAQKAAEARKAAEAQKAAEARETAKKLARAKLAHERKQAALARLRQER